MKRLWAALAMAVVIAAIIISGLFFIKKYSKEEIVEYLNDLIPNA